MTKSVKGTVLVVEDDDHLLAGIKEILQLDHYNVVTALNGVEGLIAANEQIPDIIISDIMMPKMDGIQFFKELKKERRLALIPVIFLTAKGERSDIQRGLRLGVDDYVVKPYDNIDLLVRVEAVLERQRRFAAVLQTYSGMHHHVFLSYSRKDEQTMRRITDHLRGNGLRVWVDEDDLALGTKSWRRTVQKAIEEAGCLAVLLSPDSKESDWVEAELDYAETHGKTIYPILVRGDKASSAPFGYTLAQWIDLVSKEYDTELQRLINSIRKHLYLP